MCPVCLRSSLYTNAMKGGNIYFAHNRIQKMVGIYEVTDYCMTNSRGETLATRGKPIAEIIAANKLANRESLIQSYKNNE